MSTPLVVNGQIGTDKKGAMEFVGMADRENLFDTLSSAGYFKPSRKGWYLYESLARGALRCAGLVGKGDTVTLDVQPGGQAKKTTKKRGPHGPGEHSVYKTPS